MRTPKGVGTTWHLPGYLLRRGLNLVPVFLGITVISFAVMHLAPGKPTDALTDLNVKISLEAKERLIRLYGLDRPLWQQYVSWAGRIVRGDFGRSLKDGRPVAEKVLERVPITLGINTLGILLVLGLGIPLAVTGASREGSAVDHTLTFLLFAGFSLPSFWLALLALDWLGARLAWLPVSGLFSLGAERLALWQRGLDLAGHLLIPVGVILVGGLAGITRYLRLSLLDSLGQEYIRTARAKGLPERAVLYQHALRNALLPLITLLGLSLPGLLGGSVILESIFAIPGMGRLFFDSVVARDFPVLMALLVLGAILTLLGNLLADIAYAFADPRIRFGGAEQ